MIWIFLYLCFILRSNALNFVHGLLLTMQTKIAKPQFEILDAIENNYRILYTDIQIEFRSKGLEMTIYE